ncbi:MAG: phosphotransferase [Slackia sp.]|nr:phosphotransferase [Slackia sp.]
MSDLCAFDSDFLANVDSGILDNICATLACERSDIVRVRPVKAGLTNLSVLFSCKGEQYVYRHPGAGTDEIINRQAEAQALAVAQRLGLDSTYVFEDPDQGWKISRYVAGCIDFDYGDPDHVARALALIKRLHESGEQLPWHFDFYDESCKIEALLRESGYPMPSDFAQLSAQIGALAAYVRDDGVAPVICHNDFYGPNVLVKDDGMDLIDWEYSGMGDYACDIGNFIAQGSGYSIEEAARVVDIYFGRKASESELLHCFGCTAIVGYYWYVWAIYKESQGNAMSEWLYAWYRAAQEFCARALPAYEERKVLMRPISEQEFDDLVAKEQAGEATLEDTKRLERYRVRRAVFFAAGFGSRMLPITVNTPKPLVRVHGVRIIDRLIDAVLAAGIEEIYVVRGYLKEEFDQLLAKYPMIRFIDNPLYAETNNISSAVAARGLFENAYVFESDLYLANPSLVTKYQYRSNYLGMPVDSTDDWYFDVDEEGRIIKLAKGKDAPCYQMAGLSYWTAEDGARLSEDIAEVFEESDENKQIFWDDVALRLRADRYDVRFRVFESDDIVEIDSFAELQALDSAYRVS